jgi:hypothetical protein
MLRFLGWVVNVHKSRRLDDVGLSLYSDVTLFKAFLDYIFSRGVMTQEAIVHTKLAIKVCTIFSNLTNKGFYLKAATSYVALQNELAARKTREKGSNPYRTVGKQLPGAPAAMEFVEGVVDKALAAVDEDVCIKRGGTDPTTISLSSALDVRDAAMLAMAVGHVGPTIRLSIIMSLRTQLYPDLPCSLAVCTFPGCKGNRLHRRPPPPGPPGQDALTITPSSDLELIVHHHKTSSRGKAYPPVPILSPKLHKLLNVWEMLGRPKVVDAAQATNPNYKDPATLFLTDKGRAYKSLSKWSNKVHLNNGAYPGQARPTLNDYRTIMVTDRLENPDRAGPSNDGAAILMGTSVAQWHASYWKTKRSTLATRAAGDMANYRAELLRENNVVRGLEDARLIARVEAEAGAAAADAGGL